MTGAPGTVVDSSVLLDIFTEDAKWVAWSEARLIEAAGKGPLILNAVVLAEIAPRFSRIEELESALPAMAAIEEIPAAAAFLAGHADADYRRSGGRREAILPDFLIGAHAAVSGRPLLTRDPRHVATYIPGAKLIRPGDPA
ncbi:MAG: type II toxin-antitoxin system VapC family toxin [Solirubrobacterales bacterium]